MSVFEGPFLQSMDADFVKHSQRKKLFADRYAMTNVVRPEMLNGIYGRARSVIDHCIKSAGGSIDIYVSILSILGLRL